MYILYWLYVVYVLYSKNWLCDFLQWPPPDNDEYIFIYTICMSMWENFCPHPNEPHIFHLITMIIIALNCNFTYVHYWRSIKNIYIVYERLIKYTHAHIFMYIVNVARSSVSFCFFFILFAINKWHVFLPCQCILIYTIVQLITSYTHISIFQTKKILIALYIFLPYSQLKLWDHMRISVR